MNYVINFFLYSAFSSLFREEFISIFTILSKTADDARRQMSVKSKKPEAENKDKSRQAIAELEFSIRPFSKENVKIRIESSNLKNLLWFSLAFCMFLFVGCQNFNFKYIWIYFVRFLLCIITNTVLS